jgi:uncharacterized FlaG/YvyC family protein
LGPKLKKLGNFDQFLQKYNLLLKDISPFFNIEEANKLSKLSIKIIDKNGNEVERLINSRVPGDGKSIA